MLDFPAPDLLLPENPATVNPATVILPSVPVASSSRKNRIDILSDQYFIILYFIISLFSCVRFSDVGKSDHGKSDHGKPDHGYHAQEDIFTRHNGIPTAFHERVMLSEASIYPWTFCDLKTQYLFLLQKQK